MEQAEYKQMVARLEGLTDEQFDALLETMRQRKDADGVQRLVMAPQILTLAEALLRPSCDCIQLNLTQATRVHPGERAQAPHREHRPCRRLRRRGLPTGGCLGGAGNAVSRVAAGFLRSACRCTFPVP